MKKSDITCWLFQDKIKHKMRTAVLRILVLQYKTMVLKSAVKKQTKSEAFLTLCKTWDWNGMERIS